ncbi:hypothetical protein HGRIS_011399 [Hohenbuehelia grisea]|uniref:Uncharacterized protein n=1 Tax=Hohenbuehelia grisea TaxID=104357 RepID=A0ABR3JUZ1_9AGAR
MFFKHYVLALFMATLAAAAPMRLMMLRIGYGHPPALSKTEEMNAGHMRPVMIAPGHAMALGHHHGHHHEHPHGLDNGLVEPDSAEQPAQVMLGAEPVHKKEMVSMGRMRKWAHCVHRHISTSFHRFTIRIRLRPLFLGRIHHRKAIRLIEILGSAVTLELQKVSLAFSASGVIDQINTELEAKVIEPRHHNPFHRFDHVEPEARSTFITRRIAEV